MKTILAGILAEMEEARKVQIITVTTLNNWIMKIKEAINSSEEE